jgi:hypothetical protein
MLSSTTVSLQNSKAAPILDVTLYAKILWVIQAISVSSIEHKESPCQKSTTDKYLYEKHYKKC